MAVEDKYIDSNVAVDKKTTAAFIHGSEAVIGVATFEVAVADDDGSKYRIFKNMPPDLIPVRIEIYNDAIAGGTDFDLGFYKTLTDGIGGGVIDIDKLASTLDMSSAAGRGSPKDGLENVDIDEVRERIYELAGDTLITRELGYDIVLTGNTVGGAAGTISVIAFFVQG